MAPVGFGAYPQVDFKDKRVLDVGAWDGFWTFDALKRGAREVVAIDNFSDSYEDVTPKKDPMHHARAWETFDLCREALGYTEHDCARLEMSVYDVTEARLGRFDVVLCYGVVYHLRHPLLGLDALAEVCDSTICIESAVCDQCSPYRGGLGHGYPDNNAIVMEFYPDNQYGANSGNWWAPTLTCLSYMVRSAGFRRVEARRLTPTPTELACCRGFVKGVK